MHPSYFIFQDPEHIHRCISAQLEVYLSIACVSGCLLFSKVTSPWKIALFCMHGYRVLPTSAFIIVILFSDWYIPSTKAVSDKDNEINKCVPHVESLLVLCHFWLQFLEANYITGAHYTNYFLYSYKLKWQHQSIDVWRRV